MYYNPWKRWVINTAASSVLYRRIGYDDAVDRLRSYDGLDHLYLADEKRAATNSNLKKLYPKIYYVDNASPKLAKIAYELLCDESLAITANQQQSKLRNFLFEDMRLYG